MSKKSVFWISIGTLILLAIAVRISLFGAITDDMTYFLIPWHDYFVQHGIRGITSIDSNYPVSYLYLLWIATQLPIPTVVSIKLITIFFEFVFAATVFLIIRERYPKKSLVPLFASLISLFIPTILLQGALWGQCDIIFTTFLLLSWWAVTKNRPWLTWTLFGMALAFKLQAIFFLPFLGYWWFISNKIQKPIFTKKNLTILSPLSALAILFITSLPALLAGRSLISIFSVYSGQVSDGGTNYSLGSGNSLLRILVDPLNADNIYLAKPAIILTAVIVLSILVAFMLSKYRSKIRELYYLPLTILTVVPFFLPFMRNRYSFSAEIFAFVFAFALRKRWLILVAILLQTTVLPLYADYIWKDGAIHWNGAISSLIQLCIITVMLYFLFRSKKRGSND